MVIAVFGPKKKTWRFLFYNVICNYLESRYLCTCYKDSMVKNDAVLLLSDVHSLFTSDIKLKILCLLVVLLQLLDLGAFNNPLPPGAAPDL